MGSLISPTATAGRGAGRWLLLVLVVWAALAACLQARVNVVEGKTALERQVLGAWEELSRDLVLVASVRQQGAAGEDPELSRVRLTALRARQDQLYHQDEVAEALDAGCAGENRSGRLELRPCPRMEEDHPFAQRTREVVEAENNDRDAIVAMIIATRVELEEDDRSQVESALRHLREEQARPGSWFQGDDGSWQRRPTP